jgi:hypothetical protein
MTEPRTARFADQRVSPAGPAQRSPVIVLRDETCAVLDQLDAAAKGRASIVRSCGEMAGLDEDERATLADLLRCITEQRKRIRAVRRLWQSLDSFERPAAELVEATKFCIRESQVMAEVMDPWRKHSLGQTRISLAATWDRLASGARSFQPTSAVS